MKTARSFGNLWAAVRYFDWESSTRFLYERWFWKVMTVLVTVVAVVFPKFWAVFGVLYVAFVSNYALDLTSHGAQKAAEAKDAAEK